MRFQEDVHQQLIYLGTLIVDLLIAVFHARLSGRLQTV